MRALFWFGALVVLFGAIVGFELLHFGDLFDSGQVPGPHYTLTLAGASVHVDLAQTPAELKKGLSGRASLPQGEGMLFVFENDDKHSFWMNDMYFSIDIIWLAADGKVVHIASNLSPDTYPRNFTSPKPARFVLEVPAGWAAAHQVHIGDTAQLP